MENIKEKIDSNSTVGVYIDFPFCIARCAFCDFNIQGFREGWAKRYESAVLKEIALHAKNGALKGQEIVSIYQAGAHQHAIPQKN